MLIEQRVLRKLTLNILFSNHISYELKFVVILINRIFRTIDEETFSTPFGRILKASSSWSLQLEQT